MFSDTHSNGPLIIRRQMAGDDTGARANVDDRCVRDIHLVADGYVDPDPDIVAGVSARADPDGHRQTRRAREQVRHLEQLVAVGFGDLLHGFAFERGDQPPPILGIR